MLEKDDPTIVDRFKKIIQDKPIYQTGNLFHVVESVLNNRVKIQDLVEQHGTPFYLFDQSTLDQAIDSFISAFSSKIPSLKIYYALKINHHPLFIQGITKKGLGIDVGSCRELELAVKAGCQDVIYSSPGKTDADIIFAMQYADIVTINIDSFNELKKIGELTNETQKEIKVGVRIHNELHGDWKKYGISLERLIEFWQQAKGYPLVNLRGIHFHKSRNSNADFYVHMIKALGDYLKQNFSQAELDQVKFIDFGGGFEVKESEGYFSRTKDQYHVREALTFDEYAKQIGEAIRTHLEPIVDAEYYTEPGRVLCNSAMSIVLSVVDVKDEDNVVLDGGVNMVGWQRFESEYFPLMNITAPSEREIKCKMWGNLCTTWDIWGYYCYAERFREKDVIVVPNQGALTYSLAQNFIQPIPPVYQI
ncbi:MAG: hypothetical protein ABIH67_02045 [Candidatus Uhrbacteria bacterium]|nr:hypothetical protein [Patescibacteria group bacterium]MBU1906949.1 hypothetical protein [Patescibacteria group bacterium]